MSKTIDVVVAVAAVVAIGLIYYHDRGDEALIQRLNREADSLQVAIDSTRQMAQEQQRADSIRLAYERERTRLAQARYESVKGKTDTLLDTLVTLDSASIQAVRVQFMRERMAAQVVMASQDSTIRWQATRIAYWRDTALTARDQQLAVSQRLLRDALNAKRPSHFWRGVALGATVVAGYAALR